MVFVKGTMTVCVLKSSLSTYSETASSPPFCMRYTAQGRRRLLRVVRCCLAAGGGEPNGRKMLIWFLFCCMLSVPGEWGGETCLV